MDYDETSQEVATTIAMIKSMTTTSRRRSSRILKSPMLPQINKNKRGSNSNVLPTASNKIVVDSSKPQWSVNTRSTRGVTLASIEFKRRLEKRRSKPEYDLESTADRRKNPSATEQAKIKRKERQEIPVLRSVFDASEIKSDNLYNNLIPRRCSTPLTKLNRKKNGKLGAKPTGTNGNQLILPMVSVMKITPKNRPSLPLRTKTNINSLK